MANFILHLQHTSRFVLVSFISSLALLLFFITPAYPNGDLLSLLYAFSIPSYYYLAILILTIVLSPLLYFKPVSAFIIVPKILLDSFLIADIVVFNIYRFHIDILFIKMAIFDFAGIGLSWGMILVALFSLLLVILFNFFIFKKANKKTFLSSKFANISILVIFILGQLIHIWGNFTKQEDILVYTPYLPYYAPTTSTSAMAKLQKRFPELIIVKKESDLVFTEKGASSQRFNYPITPLEFNNSDNKAPLNVLLFVVESWRSDMLTAEVTPNIDKFAKQSHQFKNHYSGGNVTVSGLFSLMFGLNPTYLSSAQSAPYKYQTMLTKSFAQQGYDIGSYTSSNLNRFSLKPMFFGDIADEDFIYTDQGKSNVKDLTVVTKLVEDIESRKSNKPWFKFVFLTSSHHDYEYPENHKVFIPVPKITAEYLFNKQVDSGPFLNDYKNSLHYVDTLFNKINQAIISSGQGENTLIIITADHGEEFNDDKQGYWGHGSNFTNPQVKVPLLVHMPTNKNSIVHNRRSAHVDIVPTLLLHVLKTKTSLKAFSSGFDLFALPEHRGVVIASYKDKSFLIGNNIYSTGLLSNKYSVTDITKPADEIDYKQLQILRQQNSHFFQ